MCGLINIPAECGTGDASTVRENEVSSVVNESGKDKPETAMLSELTSVELIALAADKAAEKKGIKEAVEVHSKHSHLLEG